MELEHLGHRSIRGQIAERLQRALERLGRLDAAACETDKKVDAGEDGFYFVQRYATKARHEGKFEAHRRYIDIQCVVKGEERIEVAPLLGLEELEPFYEDRDIGFYKDPAACLPLVLGPGDYAVLMPWDAHKASLYSGEAAEEVVKIVWKLPLEG